MQNSISLDNLFSSNKANSIDNLKSTQNNSIGIPAKDQGKSFSNMLTREVKKTESRSENEIKDSTVQDNKVESYHTDQESENVSSASEAEQYEAEKEADELSREAEELITYISTLLGISVENVQGVISELMVDAELISGENAQFLAEAFEAGAENVSQIKMQDMVALLQRTADYLASTKAAFPQEALYEKVLENAITDKQNELKGIEVVAESESNNEAIVDYAKVVSIIEKAAESGTVAMSAEPEGKEAKNIKASDNSFIETLMDSTARQTEIVEEAIALSGDELAGSQEDGADDAAATKQADANEATQADVPKAEAEGTTLAAPQPLSEIGTGAASNENEPSKPSASETADIAKVEPAESKSSKILESMQVNVMESNEVSKLETSSDDTLVKEASHSKELPPVVDNAGKNEPGEIKSFANILNVQTNANISRAEKIDIISQIMDKAKTTLKTGANMMRIQLKPERLGEVFMRISVEEGKVMAKVVTESMTAKEAIETSLYSLKETLSTQGIKIDKFNVFVGDKWQEQGNQSGFNQKPGSNGGGNGYQENGELEAQNYPDLSADALPVGLSPLDTGQLNFIA